MLAGLEGYRKEPPVKNEAFLEDRASRCEPLKFAGWSKTSFRLGKSLRQVGKQFIVSKLFLQPRIFGGFGRIGRTALDLLAGAEPTTTGGLVLKLPLPEGTSMCWV